MENANKQTFKIAALKNYGSYAFVLVVIGYLTSKVDGLAGVFGRILMVLGVIFFFLWLWRKFLK